MTGWPHMRWLLWLGLGTLLAVALVLWLGLPAALGMLTLVMGVPLNSYAASKMLRLLGEVPDNLVLRERLITCTLVILFAIVFGLIFVNNDQPIPPLDTGTTKIVTRFVAAAMVVMPATVWLVLYRKAGEPGES